MKLRRGKLYELKRTRACLIEKLNEIASYPSASILMFIKSEMEKNSVQNRRKYYFLDNNGDSVVLYQSRYDHNFSQEKWARKILREAII